MPSSYIKNKQHIYNWRETHKEAHSIQNRKDRKIHYEKNKDVINMTLKAKRKLGVDFYSLCIIYTHLYE